MYKKQLEILKSYFAPVCRYKERYSTISLIIIARENTTLTMESLRVLFGFCNTKITEKSCFKELEKNDEFKKYHEQNVENLTSLGFTFV